MSIQTGIPMVRYRKTDMIGFPKVWDFERKYADLLAEDRI
jgi:hypothetical protein